MEMIMQNFKRFKMIIYAHLKKNNIITMQNYVIILFFYFHKKIVLKELR